jgi:hypothetical protein
MMWSIPGIGMLINTVQGAKAEGSGYLPLVDFPHIAYKNFNRLQSENLQERTDLENRLRHDLGRMKEDFFKKNHYRTEFDSQGQGRVVTDEPGRPSVQEGPESTQQEAARRHHESSQRLNLTNRHNGQMEHLVNQEAAAVRGFLSKNVARLKDEGVQQELQTMIVTGKKRALKLQQDQDDERWSVAMPATRDIQEAVAVRMAELRQMEQRHLESEERSPDQQMILNYERARVGAARPQEELPMKPLRRLQKAKAGPPKQRFQEVLPGYLTASIFKLGIYEF